MVQGGRGRKGKITSERPAEPSQGGCRRGRAAPLSAIKWSRPGGTARVVPQRNCAFVSWETEALFFKEHILEKIALVDFVRNACCLGIGDVKWQMKRKHRRFLEI